MIMNRREFLQGIGATLSAISIPKFPGRAIVRPIIDERIADTPITEDNPLASLIINGSTINVSAMDLRAEWDYESSQALIGHKIMEPCHRSVTLNFDCYFIPDSVYPSYFSHDVCDVSMKVHGTNIRRKFKALIESVDICHAPFDSCMTNRVCMVMIGDFEYA